MLYTVSISKPCTAYPKSTWQSQNPPNLKRVGLRVSATLREPNGVKVEYTPWLIVGLGNPGNKYHGTRHNVGFEMVDRISQEERIVMNTIQSKALIGIGSIGEVPVLLAKPQGYMNFSGESWSEASKYESRAEVAELREKLARVEEEAELREERHLAEMEDERRKRADLETEQARQTAALAQQAALSEHFAAFIRQSGYVFPPPPPPDS